MIEWRLVLLSALTVTARLGVPDRGHNLGTRWLQENKKASEVASPNTLLIGRERVSDAWSARPQATFTLPRRPHFETRTCLMFQNKRTVIWLAPAWLVASVVLCSFLSLPNTAAPPNGKGKGGGDPPPPTLPADLDVRYAVQFIPLPSASTSNYVHDVNDDYQVVGRYDLDGVRVGFYYDAVTQTLLTADQMIPSLFTLPEQWVSTSFVGINNYGAIVGSVTDYLGYRQGILIYPTGSETGYSFEISSPGEMDSHYTKINDVGDIVGIVWDSNGVADAFAYNPGLYALEDFRDFTAFGTSVAYWDSIRVTNARLGTVLSESGEWYWLDFLNGQVSPIPLPPNMYIPSSTLRLSHDGQVPVTERIKLKKNKYSLLTPGVSVDGQYVWQGAADDSRAELVNTVSGNNVVGDVVGVNETSSVRWLRHADRPDWGYLDLDAMAVFDSVDDEQRWISISPYPTDMSDRGFTGFGTIAGHSVGFTDAAYVLIPELVSP